MGQRKNQKRNKNITRQMKIWYAKIKGCTKSSITGKFPVTMPTSRNISDKHITSHLEELEKEKLSLKVSGKGNKGGEKIMK